MTTHTPLTQLQNVALTWAMRYLPEPRAPGTTDRQVERALDEAFTGDEESPGGRLTTALVGYWQACEALNAAADAVADLLEEEGGS